MGNLFTKKVKVTDIDRAILSLKTQRRKLAQYQYQLETVIEKEKQAARDLLREKKKDRALIALKKKKTQEELLKQVDAWLINVEQQLVDIELASKQKAVFESLKTGNSAIKAIQSEIDLNDVQKLMDDTAEARAYQDEINAVLGERLSAEDEEEVLAEFENLETEMALQGLPSVPDISMVLQINEEMEVPAQKIAANEALKGVAEEPASYQKNTENLSGNNLNIDVITIDERNEILNLPNVPTKVPIVLTSNKKNANKEREQPLPA